MKALKLYIFSLFTIYLLVGLSCDDRVPTTSSAAVESGALELTYVFVTGETSNPTVVGEVLSDPSAKTSIIVVARLLDADGNGVNDKSLQFSSDVDGDFDTSDPSTKYVPNFKEYGYPDMGGNGYAYARFTPKDDVSKIETAASSGAIITVKYTSDIIDNVEFSVFNSKDLIWPYTMNITAESQIGLGENSAFEVLLQNKYGDELAGVRLVIESENGSIACGDTCYTDATGRVNTTFESYGFSENVGPGNVNTSFYHPTITDTVNVAKQIVIGTESAVGSCAYIEIPSSSPSEIVVKDGGGIESTDIKAEIYDSNGNLLTTPVTVNFRLEPVLAGTYLNSPEVTNVNVESVNGIATVSLNSGTEVLLRTLTSADFAVGPTGLPRHQLTVTLGESIAALGLSSSQYTGGDVINIRLQLNLTDGRSYTAKDAASSLTGSYFKSPYIYNMTIKCIPTGAVAGDYTIDMIDSWGDGWNGASITVTIDGVAQTVGLPSGANGSQTVTVPAGATSMSFAYVSGDWDSEVTYTITFNNGGADQVAISETNPGAGVKVLSVCP